jgi:hypothetical protein
MNKGEKARALTPKKNSKSSAAGTSFVTFSRLALMESKRRYGGMG